MGKNEGTFIHVFARTLFNMVNLLTEEVMKLTETASKVADENEGQLLFEHVAFIISQHERAADIPMEGSDPKVIEFLRIL